ncbi:hypothetical protein GWN42_02360 [candidate division KSB1 bacterium]|nr:hypothetical protein [candidate division KSB1 bacterium]NIW18182.1 hypothetical protein [candidate division KSB1 bacterium]
MHTAEHILSAVMKHHYDAPRNLELHLGEKKTKCDYQVPKPLREDDIDQIERLVNNQIQKNHPASAFFLNRHQAEDYDLWKVPEDAEEIRIVRIGDFDAQPCSGEHVSNTGEIGTFRISSFEMKDSGRVRIRFKID